MSDRIPIQVDPDLAELIPGFLDNRRRDVVKLQTLLDASDFASIRLLGHSMKGAGGGYGFDAITDIGAAIEHAALAVDVPGVKQQLECLADYLARIDVEFGA